MFEWLREMFCPKQEVVIQRNMVIHRKKPDLHKFTEVEIDAIVALFKAYHSGDSERKYANLDEVSEELNKTFGLDKSTASYKRVFNKYLQDKNKGRC